MYAAFRQHRWLFWSLLAAAVALRLYFVLPSKGPLDGDAYFYDMMGRGLLHFGTYGVMHGPFCLPTMMRMPGYSIFLAGVYALFGDQNLHAVTALQGAIDVWTCLLVAAIAGRLMGARAARWALALAAICPFTANYTGVILTETLELFCTALAVWLAILAFDSYTTENKKPIRALLLWAASGLAVTYAILLRPDGGILMAAMGCAILWQGWRQRKHWRHFVLAALVFGCFSLSALAPWTTRNWFVFHRFQPLVNPYAVDPGEFDIDGFNHWVYSWALDYSITEDLLFHVSGGAMQMSDFPNRAFSNDDQRRRVAALVDAYNANGFDMTREMDAGFNALYQERLRQHPIEIRLVYPTLRVADMWLRPRTEMLPIDCHWWRFSVDPHDSSIATALGVLNLLFVLAALAAAIFLRGKIRYLGLLTLYPLLRSAVLWKLLAVEQRYTLECYPIVLVLAGCLLAAIFAGRRKAGTAVAPEA